MTMKIKWHKAPTNIFIALFCMFLWGSAFPMIKLGYEELQIAAQDIFPKLTFAGWRFFLAGLWVALYGFIFGRRGIWAKEDIKFSILLAFVQTGVHYFFFYIAAGYTSGIKSAVLQSASAFFIVILAHFFFKDDRLNARKALALVLGFLGIIVINLGQGFDWHFSLRGEGFMLIATLLISVGTILVKKFGQGRDPFTMASVQMSVGGLMLLVVGKIGMGFEPLPMTGKAYGFIIYGAFLSSTAYVLWYQLLLHNPAGRISLYRLFIPIFGAILSALLLPGETFTWQLVLGLGLVALGMLVLNVQRQRKGESLEKAKP